MKLSEIRTAPVFILKKQVKKKRKRILKFCKRNFAEYLDYAEKTADRLNGEFDNRYLPFHYIVSEGELQPLTAYYTAELTENEEITAQLEKLKHSCDFYLADTSMLDGMRLYCLFIRMYRAAAADNKEEFGGLLNKFIFPFSKNSEQISEAFDPVLKMLCENDGFNRLTAGAKQACRKKIAMTAFAADISEQRLVIGYLSGGGDIAGMADKDFYRVFPFPSAKKYIRSIIIPPLITAAAGAFIFRQPLFLLTVLPLYSAAKLTADKICMRYYGRFYSEPPSLNCGGKIPGNAKTLCVISTLLTCAEDVENAVEKARNFLNKNRTDNLEVCLLCDLPPSRTESRDSDKEIISACKACVSDKEKISVFLRPRTQNAQQGCYMGYERKRGAIVQLTEYFIKGRGDFEIYGTVPQKPVYYLVLDYDTESTIDSAAALVGYALAPSNQPVVADGRTVSGYGIIVPKCVPDLYSCMKSGFAEIFGGRGGQSAENYNGSSDFYMNVFRDGIFCGKGLIHVESFYKCCIEENNFPENKILSHDILEGNLLRCASVNVQMTESVPQDSTGFFSRLSRWQRGDVQNLPFLLSKKLPFTSLGRFKLFDNLMRALTPIFTLLCLLSSDDITALTAIICSAALFAAGGFGRRRYFSRMMSDISSAVSRLLCEIILAAKNGVDSITALFLTLYRMAVGKKLLSWTTAFQVSKSKNTAMRTARQFLIPEAVSLLILISGINSPVCFAAGILNLTALPVFMVLDREKKPQSKPEISEKIRTALLDTAKAELNFFLKFTTAEENHLPPDNIQLVPELRIAHRTSPTNIGMYLLALYSGLELGILPKEEYRRRTLDTLLTVQSLEKWHGHLFNWYNTQTKKPMDSFVSSVDSGNFLCCLTAVKQGIQTLFPELYDMLCGILSSADMRAFYNENSGLLAIGYDGKKAELTENCYDLLMSEARMASYYGIAKNQLPKSHWHRLSRIMGSSGRYCGCLSWSGTCFEYFMPQLVLPAPKGSLLYENLRYAVHCQKKAAHKKLYGISESAFYSFDRELNYQYFAFGVPLAALRPDFHYEKVYSPYSAFLMLSNDFELSYNLLCDMRKCGLYNCEYGYYEAVDFSDERTDYAEGAKIIKSFMAHHKGMSIAGTANALLDDILIKNFMSDSDMKRGIEMTEERINSGELYLKRHGRSKKNLLPSKNTAAGTVQDNMPAIITNGRISAYLLPSDIASCGSAVQISAMGKSLFYPAVFGRYDRNNPYPSFDTAVCENSHRYSIRNGALSSAENSGVYTLNERELIISEKISLPDDSPAILHEFSLENTSSAERILDLTIYMRAALGKENEVVAHPAFSDLFLSCEYHEKERAVTVCRRHRQSGEQSCMAVVFEDNPEYFYSFDREEVNRLKPLTENNAAYIPAPCVYLSLPVRLKSGQKKKIRMFICCANDKKAALNIAATAVNSKQIKSAVTQKKPAASDIIARTILPHILLKYRNKRPRHKPSVRFSSLWKYGIATDRPAVLFNCSDDGECLFAMLKAARKLKLSGLDFSLIVICACEKSRADTIKQSVSRSFGADDTVKVIYKGDIDNEDLACLEYYCCYAADAGSPVSESSEKANILPVKQGLCVDAQSGFSQSGEFTVTEKPPVPWSKVLANPEFGALVHTNSLGFCWAKNSSLNTMTPWDNDITGRNNSCALYLKAKDCYIDLLENSTCTFKKNTAEYCGIAAKNCAYTVTVTVPQKGQAEIIRITLTNRSDKDNEFTPVLLAKLSGTNVTMMKNGCLCAERLSDDEFFGQFALKAFGGHEYYGTSSEKVLSGEFTVGFDGDALAGACGLKVPAHGTKTAVFILSYYSRFASPDALNDVITDPSKRKLLMSDKPRFDLKIRTGDKLINEMMNTWLPDQIIKGRIFSRTGFYQNGGAFGFRDQLQDGMAAAYTRPEILERLIYRSCASQFEEGDVLHWYHVTEKNKMGVRTACSDDMLWLPFAACHYAKLTGNHSVFTRNISYCTGEAFHGEEIYMAVGKTDRRDSVINHCLAAADYAYKTGPHGLILMGGGDWNDSYNRVGEKGTGESVWLSMFLCMVYDSLCALPPEIMPREKKDEYLLRSKKLRENINLHAYENGYYLRAFYDSGEKMGAQGENNCQIDLLPQAFSVLADINDEQNISRSRSAVNLALTRLADYDGGLIKLFTPPFSYSGKENKTGYVCSYPEGVRENGGQYTHAAIWLCMAVNKLGYRDEAYRLLKMLCPAYKDTAVFKNEPYYMSADVYTNPECYGRAGWSLYTGAAAWYYRAMLDLIGIDIENGKLKINHAPPAGLGKCEVEFNGEKFGL